VTGERAAGGRAVRSSPGRGTALTAVVLITVVLITMVLAAVLTGCGGGGDRDAAGPAPSGTPAAGVPSVPASGPAPVTGTTEPPAAPTPGIGPDGTARTGPATGPGGSGPGSSGGSATVPATVPKEQLTPATGTFTENQREYLSGKVPRGMDPAAVLQTGQESCERIANTADADPALARQAVNDGEIADARDAITFLCPKFRNLLD
jgi:hypothetical protein